VSNNTLLALPGWAVELTARVDYAKRSGRRLAADHITGLQSDPLIYIVNTTLHLTSLPSTPPSKLPEVVEDDPPYTLEDIITQGQRVEVATAEETSVVARNRIREQEIRTTEAFYKFYEVLITSGVEAFEWMLRRRNCRHIKGYLDVYRVVTTVTNPISIIHYWATFTALSVRNVWTVIGGMQIRYHTDSYSSIFATSDASKSCWKHLYTCGLLQRISAWVTIWPMLVPFAFDGLKFLSKFIYSHSIVVLQIAAATLVAYFVSQAFLGWLDFMWGRSLGDLFCMLRDNSRNLWSGFKLRTYDTLSPELQATICAGAGAYNFVGKVAKDIIEPNMKKLDVYAGLRIENEALATEERDLIDTFWSVTYLLRKTFCNLHEAVGAKAFFHIPDVINTDTTTRRNTDKDGPGVKVGGNMPRYPKPENLPPEVQAANLTFTPYGDTTTLGATGHHIQVSFEDVPAGSAKTFDDLWICHRIPDFLMGMDGKTQGVSLEGVGDPYDPKYDAMLEEMPDTSQYGFWNGFQATATGTAWTRDATAVLQEGEVGFSSTLGYHEMCYQGRYAPDCVRYMPQMVWLDTGLGPRINKDTVPVLSWEAWMQLPPESRYDLPPGQEQAKAWKKLHIYTLESLKLAKNGIDKIKPDVGTLQRYITLRIATLNTATYAAYNACLERTQRFIAGAKTPLLASEGPQWCEIPEQIRHDGRDQQITLLDGIYKKYLQQEKLMREEDIATHPWRYTRIGYWPFSKKVRNAAFPVKADKPYVVPRITHEVPPPPPPHSPPPPPPSPPSPPTQAQPISSTPFSTSSAAPSSAASSSLIHTATSVSATPKSAASSSLIHAAESVVVQSPPSSSVPAVLASSAPLASPTAQPNPPPLAPVFRDRLYSYSNITGIPDSPEFREYMKYCTSSGFFLYGGTVAECAAEWRKQHAALIRSTTIPLSKGISATTYASKVASSSSRPTPSVTKPVSLSQATSSSSVRSARSVSKPVSDTAFSRTAGTLPIVVKPAVSASAAPSQAVPSAYTVVKQAAPSVAVTSASTVAKSAMSAPAVPSAVVTPASTVVKPAAPSAAVTPASTVVKPAVSASAATPLPSPSKSVSPSAVVTPASTVVKPAAPSAAVTPASAVVKPAAPSAAVTPASAVVKPAAPSAAVTPASAVVKPAAPSAAVTLHLPL
jgi:hypothetical protein